ncbi:MAG: methyltransferase domain-containing protein [Patescibacteria group bacterium UBA2103]
MEQKSYYNTRTPYEKISRGRYESIARLLKKKNVRAVLDIGCGVGGLGKKLKEDGIVSSVYGLDISKEAVGEAKSVLDGAWVFDAESNSFPKEVPLEDVDIIIISEVLEHLFDPEEFLKNVRAVSSAPILISVPNILFWKNRLKLLFGSFRYTQSGLMDRGHIRFFTPDTLKETLIRAGYETVGTDHVFPTRITSLLNNVFPGLFARQFVVLADPIDVLVYTAIFGKYDTLAPAPSIPGVAFVCVTDSEKYKVSGWTMQYMEPQYEDVVRNARFVKVNPHIVFRHIPTSIWIDGNISVVGDVKEALEKYLADGVSMAVYDHGSTVGDARTSLFEEAGVLIASGKKDDPEVMQKQIDRYKEEGYADDQGLISSMVMFRRHMDPVLQKGLSRWWEEIEGGSRRDQLSFNYAMWKEGVPFTYIKEDSRNNAYFVHVPHKKRS